MPKHFCAVQKRMIPRHSSFESFAEMWPEIDATCAYLILTDGEGLLPLSFFALGVACLHTALGSPDVPSYSKEQSFPFRISSLVLDNLEWDFGGGNSNCYEKITDFSNKTCLNPNSRIEADELHVIVKERKEGDEGDEGDVVTPLPLCQGRSTHCARDPPFLPRLSHVNFGFLPRASCYAIYSRCDGFSSMPDRKEGLQMASIKRSCWQLQSEGNFPWRCKHSLPEKSVGDVECFVQDVGAGEIKIMNLTAVLPVGFCSYSGILFLQWDGVLTVGFENRKTLSTEKERRLMEMPIAIQKHSLEARVCVLMATTFMLLGGLLIFVKGWNYCRLKSKKIFFCQLTVKSPSSNQKELHKGTRNRTFNATAEEGNDKADSFVNDCKRIFLERVQVETGHEASVEGFWPPFPFVAQSRSLRFRSGQNPPSSAVDREIIGQDGETAEGTVTVLSSRILYNAQRALQDSHPYPAESSLGQEK